MIRTPTTLQHITAPGTIARVFATITSQRRIEDEGGRALKTRVKTARKRSLASTLWLERQLNDPYVAQARREGYRSRAAYKLIEVDDKYKLLRPGQRIVDLGAAPGGWSQVAAARVQAREGRGRVIAIDVLEMDAIEGVEFRRLDFHDPEAPARLREWLGGAADGVILRHGGQRHRPPQDGSTAHRRPRRARRRFRQPKVLAPGGFFLAKVLQGGPRATCSPASSASSPPCAIAEAARRAAPAAPSSTCWRPGFRSRSLNLNQFDGFRFERPYGARTVRSDDGRHWPDADRWLWRIEANRGHWLNGRTARFSPLSTLVVSY